MLNHPQHTPAQIPLLNLPRAHPLIMSAVREKRLRLALDHINRAINAAPFLSKPLQRAARECVLAAQRTAARDEAEIVQVLQQGFSSVDEIAAKTPSKISREQVNKILHELASLNPPAVRKGRKRDPNYSVGRGGNNYIVVWSLLIDDEDDESEP